MISNVYNILQILDNSEDEQLQDIIVIIISEKSRLIFQTNKQKTHNSVDIQITSTLYKIFTRSLNKSISKKILPHMIILQDQPQKYTQKLETIVNHQSLNQYQKFLQLFCKFFENNGSEPSSKYFKLSKHHLKDLKQCQLKNLISKQILNNYYCYYFFLIITIIIIVIIRLLKSTMNSDFSPENFLFRKYINYCTLNIQLQKMHLIKLIFQQCNKT
eukprot:TRINITY_DN8579_c0_g1_i11.p1 TRINITY_DN8579_c0_g1~~TRINITY_DN8579_c0_g1_i11.p1  ORF type:complete len:216 (-),score=-10.31 TRINITY_DN8579_c0_g1_i11:622-1269(-)